MAANQEAKKTMQNYLRIKNLQFFKTQLFFTINVFIIVLCFTSSAVIQDEKVDVAKVWAGHPVNFAIKTLNNFQCVAYYDTTRKMVIASRTVGSNSWSYTTLRNTPTGWDSHNYIDMAIDDSGYIHVCGDMHNVKLIYFRSKKPLNTSSFDTPGMVGTLENSVTYPVFIKGPDNKLFFQFRDGGSGNGTTIWNTYDSRTKKWSRITENGLFNGENTVNAYQTSPVLGPDNFFHVIWMWRDDPNANTNHHLSHIKSKDLITWQTMADQNVTIPVKQSTSGVVVDPVLSRHGLINMDFWISWDRKNRAVLTYHRYDNNSISQIFNTRWEGNSWKIYQTSDWKDFTWDLERTGSLEHDIAARPLTVDENDELVQDYIYRAGPLRRWVLDEETLRPKSDTLYVAPEPMQVLYKVESSFNGMQVNFIQDGEYYIRWETMPINQDQARATGTYPSSSMLRVYKFSKPAVSVVKNAVQTVRDYHISATPEQIAIRYTGSAQKSPSLHTILLTSLSGQVVFQRTTAIHQCLISVSNVNPGVYILKISSDAKNADGIAQVRHIVVQR